MQYIVDRIEEDYVVCEDEQKQMHDIKRDIFPENIKAGDVIIEANGKIYIDKEKTEKRAEEIRTLMDELWD